MKILLTNDDGYFAPGIQALKRAIPQGAEAVLVAPANEKSASSHSITLGSKLRVEKIPDPKIQVYAVHGTPADCVKFAIAEIPGFKPDLIISGINQGANTGVSVYYSGTISAAREGAINRIPSIAVSLCSKTFPDFGPSVAVTRDLIAAVRQTTLPQDCLINVNVPALNQEQISGIRITKQAASHFIEEFVPEQRHGHVQVYTLAGEIEIYEPDGKSDEEAINDGFISITPLRLDLTHDTLMPVFEKWFAEK